MGAIAGPVVTGWVMGVVGPQGFFLYIGILLIMLVAYGFWRMSRRASRPVAEQGAFVDVAPQASVVAADMVPEAALEGHGGESATGHG